MKIYSITIVLLILSLTSCVDKREQNLKKMELEFRQKLNDFAFKENATIKILQLKVLGYDTVSESILDSVTLHFYNQQFEKYKEKADLAIQSAKLQSQLWRLSASIGSNVSTDIAKEELDDDIKKAKQYQDSMINYAKLDSILNAKLNTHTYNKIYKTKIFLKAVFKENDKEENFIDTINMFYSRDFKMMNSLF
jgi:hypothetical protein